MSDHTPCVLRPAIALWMCASGVHCVAELEVAAPAPVADSGFDQVRVLDGDVPLVVELDGRASCDPLDPSAQLRGAWRVVRAPGADVPELEHDPSGLQARFMATRPGEYELGLVVAVDGRVSAEDTVRVQVVGAQLVASSAEEARAREVVLPPPATDACGGPLR